MFVPASRTFFFADFGRPTSAQSNTVMFRYSIGGVLAVFGSIPSLVACLHELRDLSWNKKVPAPHAHAHANPGISPEKGTLRFGGRSLRLGA